MNMEDMDDEDVVLYLQGAQDILSVLWTKKELDIEAILDKVSQTKKEMEILTAQKRMSFYIQ